LPKTRSYIETILQNAKLLLSIINDILDISRIESGKMELDNVPFTLSELNEQCKVIIYPEASEKGLKLEFHTGTFDKLLVGDLNRLRQVMVNIISNAVKFTEYGDISVSTAAMATSKDTATVFCQIKDSGIGMTQEEIDRIFEPFAQADISITRKYGGTGLGLAIVKNLLALMDSEFRIESTPGEGTTFSFSLKLKLADALEASSEHESHENHEKPSFHGEVLVCEDNDMNQLVIVEHLSNVGVKVAIAENGEIGVNMVRERSFDLVFMDIYMPVMDGIEATKKILAIRPEIPIVAMTANVMDTDIAFYLKNGMRDCIGKPFATQELWACLQKYL
jgi:CheY-like chemotaxis protein